MQPIALFLKDEQATSILGEDLALALTIGDCLALSGDLGAGKSTLARALIRAIADDDSLDVPSPTFTLVQSYDLRIAVSHFDLYRLTQAEEFEELGFDEALAQGICLVEWPDNAGDALQASRINLVFSQSGEGREVLITGPDVALARIRRTLAIRAFLALHLFGGVTRRHLSGDASSRAYQRILHAGSTPMILMDAPRRPPGAIVTGGKTYPQLAHIAEDVVPFVAVARLLGQFGLSAPAVHAADLEAGILLIEDLGSDGILDTKGEPVAERYRESLSVLAHLHAQKPVRSVALENGLSHTIPPFDRTAMKIETQLLLDWYLPWALGRPATDIERESYAAVWDGLVDRLETSETHLLLRDFHSPNILWRDGRSGLDRVGIIDFQDAMIGPTAYDVASIVQDARVTIPPVLAHELLAHYTAMRRASGSFDQPAFLRDFHILAAQRNCKLAGIWVRLKERDGKPAYMKHMPRTFAYLQDALRHDALRPLRDWFIRAAIIPDESAA